METLPPNPGFPPCLVCGIGFAVTRTDAVVTLPGNSYQTCATIAPMTGELGFIEELVFCLALPAFLNAD